MFYSEYVYTYGGGLVFGAQIFASLFHPLAKTQLWSVTYHMKAHMPKIQNRYIVWFWLPW